MGVADEALRSGLDLAVSSEPYKVPASSVLLGSSATTMSYDPEIVAALASNPEYTQPQAPPEGVPLIDYARQQASAVIAPFSQYYKAELPDGTLSFFLALIC